MVQLVFFFLVLRTKSVFLFCSSTVAYFFLPSEAGFFLIFWQAKQVFFCNQLRVLALGFLFFAKKKPASLGKKNRTKKEKAKKNLLRFFFSPLEKKKGKTKNHKIGNIAQLVEHCLCKAGAKGSNPFISTLPFIFSFHLFSLFFLCFAKRSRFF